MSLEDRILKALIDEWGYVIGSAGLRQVLAFPSQAALRHAVAKQALPFPVFRVPGRKGPYALAHDVAAWLASRGMANSR